MRQRYLYEAVAKWYVRRFENCYISETPTFLEYLHIIAEEPCERTIPRSRLCALALLEHMAAGPEEDKDSNQTTVIDTVTPWR